MPVHWYYDVSVLKRDYGRITDYQAPKERHPGAAPGEGGGRASGCRRRGRPMGVGRAAQLLLLLLHRRTNTHSAQPV